MQFIRFQYIKVKYNYERIFIVLSVILQLIKNVYINLMFLKNTL